MNASGDFGPAQIAAVHIGTVAPLGPDAEPSAFIKHAVSGPVQAGPLGLAGDEQADLTVHGGPDKAVYGYSAGHYPAWAADFPGLAARFTAGSMGENMSITGLDEAQIHIGDIIRHGGAVLQVTQPRQPCFKLALAFGNPRLVRAMTRNGRSGWYYRVLEPGDVAAGDTLTLLDRPNPGWPLARFNAAILRNDHDAAAVAELAALAGLAANWQARFSQALLR